MTLPFLTNRLALLALGLTTSLGLASCFEDGKENDPSPSQTVSESLHFAFKTPDWERHIDCTALNLGFSTVSTKVAYVGATSASTSASFYFTYPADSSTLVQPSALGKYAIGEYQDNSGAYELSHKVPTTDGSSGRLVSLAGKADNSYNEILAVKYVGHEGKYSLFEIKARYQMQMQEILNGTRGVIKPVSGSFKFRVRANAK
ncbi:hypothetical protein [Hymenobacter chitinivorans]|uniref:Heme-binding HmuY-like protein n=1 Tax=Hymenobacter chitinivorans DSM 11115 TaxID=1121954 RepID=A0A2M9BN17_9BACT|nr:hypothetical protein [Hymenobacter chitinivorans]PJJ59339.1 hypothetical protein CLV45_0756 [Hymenobacter chitinivorans DSM 11115]